MKLTLLSMTQSILSNLSSDEVNSISDTTESLQIAEIVKTCFFNIISRAELPEQKKLYQLDPSTDTTAPNMMYLPAGVKTLEWIKYLDNSTPITVTSASTTSNTIGTGSKTFTTSASLSFGTGDVVTATSGVNSMSGTVISYASTTLVINVTSVVGSGTFTSWVITGSPIQSPGYKYVTVLPLQQFTDYVNAFSPGAANVDVLNFAQNGKTFSFNYKDDVQPSFCTVVSNYYVIFDSFNQIVDSTLQASKTMCFGLSTPTFTMTDSFVPDLDEQQVALLLNEAKSLAFFELKQQAHPKAEQEAKRQWNTLQKNKSIDNKPSYFDQLPDYGRIPRSNYGPRIKWH